MQVGAVVRQDKKPSLRLARKITEGNFDICCLAERDSGCLDGQRARSRIDGWKMLYGMSLRVLEKWYTRKVWSNLSQHLEPFSARLRLEGDKARDVVAGPRDAFDKSGGNWIVGVHEHNRDRPRCLLQGGNDGRAFANQNIRLELNQ